MSVLDRQREKRKLTFGHVLHDATILLLCYQIVVIWVTITFAHAGGSPVQTVPACPVQTRVHHHINVCTDINNGPLGDEALYTQVYLWL